MSNHFFTWLQLFKLTIPFGVQPHFHMAPTLQTHNPIRCPIFSHGSNSSNSQSHSVSNHFFTWLQLFKLTTPFGVQFFHMAPTLQTHNPIRCPTTFSHGSNSSNSQPHSVSNFFTWLQLFKLTTPFGVQPLFHMAPTLQTHNPIRCPTTFSHGSNSSNSQPHSVSNFFTWLQLFKLTIPFGVQPLFHMAPTLQTHNPIRCPTTFSHGSNSSNSQPHSVSNHFFTWLQLFKLTIPFGVQPLFRMAPTLQTHNPIRCPTTFSHGSNSSNSQPHSVSNFFTWLQLFKLTTPFGVQPLFHMAPTLQTHNPIRCPTTFSHGSNSSNSQPHSVSNHFFTWLQLFKLTTPFGVQPLVQVAPTLQTHNPIRCPTTCSGGSNSSNSQPHSVSNHLFRWLQLFKLTTPFGVQPLFHMAPTLQTHNPIRCPTTFSHGSNSSNSQPHAVSNHLFRRLQLLKLTIPPRLQPLFQAAPTLKTHNPIRCPIFSGGSNSSNSQSHSVSNHFFAWLQLFKLTTPFGVQPLFHMAPTLQTHNPIRCPIFSHGSNSSNSQPHSVSNHFFTWLQLFKLTTPFGVQPLFHMAPTLQTHNPIRCPTTFSHGSNSSNSQPHSVSNHLFRWLQLFKLTTPFGVQPLVQVAPTLQTHNPIRCPTTCSGGSNSSNSQPHSVSNHFFTWLQLFKLTTPFGVQPLFHMAPTLQTHNPIRCPTTCSGGSNSSNSQPHSVSNHFFTWLQLFKLTTLFGVQPLFHMAPTLQTHNPIRCPTTFSHGSNSSNSQPHAVSNHLFRRLQLLKLTIPPRLQPLFQAAPTLKTHNPTETPTTFSGGSNS